MIYKVLLNHLTPSAKKMLEMMLQNIFNEHEASGIYELYVEGEISLVKYIEEVFPIKEQTHKDIRKIAVQHGIDALQSLFKHLSYSSDTLLSEYEITAGMEKDWAQINICAAVDFTPIRSSNSDITGYFRCVLLSSFVEYIWEHPSVFFKGR